LAALSHERLSAPFFAPAGDAATTTSGSPAGISYQDITAMLEMDPLRRQVLTFRARVLFVGAS